MYNQISFSYAEELEKTGNIQFIKLDECSYDLAKHGLSSHKKQKFHKMKIIAIKMVKKCCIDVGDLNWLSHIKTPYILTLTVNTWLCLSKFIYKIIFPLTADYVCNNYNNCSEIFEKIGIESLELYNDNNIVLSGEQLQTRTFYIDYQILSKIMMEPKNINNCVIKELVYWLYKTSSHSDLLPNVTMGCSSKMISRMIDTNVIPKV